MAKIFAVVPTDSCHVHVELVSRLIVWAKAGALCSAIAGVRPVDHARNEAVRLFMQEKHKEFTHLFFVDDDTIPPFDAINKLLRLDTDIATGLTKILRKEENGDMVTSWNAFLNHWEDEGGKSNMETVDENTGIQKVIRAGTSCMLIKREVFEKLGDPWFKTEWTEKYDGYKSEDITFCDKAVAAGLTILADTSVICKHNKSVML